MSYKIFHLDTGTMKTEILPSEHSQFLLMSSEFWLGAHLRSSGKYEYHIIKAAEPHINPDMNIVDIGANMGTHTIEFAKRLRSGKVFSFEPQRIVFQQLNANVFVNRLFNVHTFNTGLGSENKKTHIVSDGKSIDYTEFRTFGCAYVSDNTQGEEITIKTLDSFGIENVGLIKIDVEGYELEVLKGAINTIKKNHPIIIYENHDKPEVHEFLKGIGYNIQKIDDKPDFIAKMN